MQRGDREGAKMGFRFRIGPFTIGPSGLRLSWWKRLFGFSIPLMRPEKGKGGSSFGVLRFWSFRWWFSGKKW